MRKYVLRRLILFIPTLVAVSIAVFVLLRIIPGDIAALILSGPSGELTYTPEEAEALREQMGLNDPIYVQYVDWMWDFVRADLGESFVTRLSISDQIKRQMPITVQLAMFSMIVISIISIPIGVLAAVRQDSFVDYILRGFAILGLAMPSFFVALLVVLFLSVAFSWSTPLGFVHLWQDPNKSFQQLIFPAIALGFASSGLLVRMTRAQLLEVLREDYVRTARAKGLGEKAVVMRHAVCNALLPVITVGGTQIGFLFSGTVIIESIFNIPGVGRGLISALNSRDLPAIQVYIMYFAMIALVANLIVDLMYAWLDPRIRYA